MVGSEDEPKRWWQQRGPSLVVFAGVVLVVAIAAAVVGGQVAKVLPDVGKDQLGTDRWTNPIGLERVEELQLAHIPDCAAGQVTRIVLWDSNSEPYWEVAGPPTAMVSFVVGIAPAGFAEVEPYRAPPSDEVLRLVAFRRSGGPVGIRYTIAQVPTGRVVSGTPLRRYTGSGFQEADLCNVDGGGGDDASTTTTEPG